MSDNKTGGKNVARQENSSNYELARAYAKEALGNSAAKAGELANNPPQSKEGAAIFAARTAMAGGNAMMNSAKHAGMGFMEAMRQQNPNDGQQLNNMKISQALEQGRQQNEASLAKANEPNKGITALREKTTNNQSQSNATQSVQLSNKGISDYQSKANGQSTTNSKANSSGTSKGASVSSGSSSGGQSSGSSQGR